MLKKINRASRKEIEEIFRKGKYINSPVFTFKFLKGNIGKKISVIAPKNIARTAVKRNLLRRRGYRALEKYLSDFPIGTLGAFLFKKHEENISILENEIKSVLDKIN